MSQPGPSRWRGGGGGFRAAAGVGRAGLRGRRQIPAFFKAMDRHIHVVHPGAGGRRSRKHARGDADDPEVIDDEDHLRNPWEARKRDRPRYEITRDRITRRLGMFSGSLQSELVFRHLPKALEEKIDQDVADLFAQRPGEARDDDRWTRAAPVAHLQPKPAQKSTKTTGATGNFAKASLYRVTQNEAAVRKNGGEKENSWNAGQPSISRTVAMSAHLSQKETLDEPNGDEGERRGKRKSKQEVFPSDPPIAEIAERILAVTPQLYLRDGHSDTYDMAACALIVNALRSNKAGNTTKKNAEDGMGAEDAGNGEGDRSNRLASADIYDQTTRFSLLPRDDDSGAGQRPIISERVFASPYRPEYGGKIQQRQSDSENEYSDSDENGDADFEEVAKRMRIGGGSPFMSHSVAIANSPPTTSSSPNTNQMMTDFAFFLRQTQTEQGVDGDDCSDLVNFDFLNLGNTSGNAEIDPSDFHGSTDFDRFMKA